MNIRASKFPTGAVVATFVGLGPLPIAIAGLLVSVFIDGFRGFALGSIWMFLTYVSGAIPAAVAGAVFAGICWLLPTGKSQRSAIAMHSILGAFVGGMVGVLIGLLFFE